MLNQSSIDYQYNIILDILAEVVTNYITEQSNSQKGEMENADKNNK